MSNKKFQKLLAILLTGTMLLGMGITSMAAEDDPATEGGTTGAGDFEGHVDKKILQVDLPTVAEGDTTFAYTMDPEGLIAATEGAKDTEATFESGANVYFLSSAKNYTKDSAKLKIVNTGNVDADVTVAAETAANANVTMASSSTFAEDNTNKELYLGLKVANQTETAIKAHADGTDPVAVTVGLKGKSDNFEVTYNSETQKYGYTQVAGLADTAWNSFEFGLTGACNANGDWSADGLVAPDVTVTWSYAEREADSSNPMLEENASVAPADVEPSIPSTPFSYERDATLDITADFGTGTPAATSITKVEASNDGTVVTADFTTVCTIVGNKITLSSGQFGGAGVGDNRYLIVTFNNGKTARATLNITK